MGLVLRTYTIKELYIDGVLSTDEGDEEEVLILSSFTADDVEDNDYWVFAETSISSSTDLENFNAVLAEVKDEDPTREITVKFSKLTALYANIFEDALFDHIELPLVSAISNSAYFKNATSLKSVSMPKAAGKIGSNVFNGCTSLVDFNAPDGESGIYLDGITSSGNSTFKFCEAITYVSAPDYLTVDDSTHNTLFSGCTALEELYMPLLTYTASNMISGCAALETVEFPALLAVDASLFDGFKNLTYVDIDSATTIGDSAFRYCESLTTMLAAAVETIGAQSFYECFALKSINARELAEEVYLPALTTVGNNVFTFCESITSISVPKLSTMGNRMFGGMDALRTLELATEVTAADYVSYGSNIFGSEGNSDNIDTTQIAFITGTDSFIASQIEDKTWTFSGNNFIFSSIAYN